MLTDNIGSSLTGTFLPGASFFGIPKALLNQLATPAIQIHEVTKVLQQFLEQPYLIGVFGEHPTHHFLNFFPKRITHSGTFLAPANGGKGKFVEELANRMATTIEKVLVAECDLEHRNL